MLPAERCEIGDSHEAADGQVHCRDIERTLHVPGGPGRERIENRSVPDAIPIAPPCCREASMEIVRYFDDGIHRDLRRELPVQAPPQRVDIEGLVDREADDLVRGMYAAVGTTGNDRPDGPRSPEQSGFQIALNGPHVVLACIAMEVRSVVCKVHPIGRHPATTPRSS